MPEQPISRTVLNAMERDGWTPTQVRALIAGHRELTAENQELADDLQHAQTHCLIHDDMAHGGEAEELRKGTEKLLAEYWSDDRYGVDELVRKFQRLLDDVCARDSLAWLERHDEKRDAELIELKRRLEELETAQQKAVQHG